MAMFTWVAMYSKTKARDEATLGNKASFLCNGKHGYMSDVMAVLKSTSRNASLVNSRSGNTIDTDKKCSEKATSKKTNTINTIF